MPAGARPVAREALGWPFGGRPGRPGQRVMNVNVFELVSPPPRCAVRIERPSRAPTGNASLASIVLSDQAAQSGCRFVCTSCCRSSLDLGLVHGALLPQFSVVGHLRRQLRLQRVRRGHCGLSPPGQALGPPRRVFFGARPPLQLAGLAPERGIRPVPQFLGQALRQVLILPPRRSRPLAASSRIR